MFTGLIQDCGAIESISDHATGRRLGIATRLGEQLCLGDSVSVNGVCLTVERRSPGGVVATVVSETLGRTTLGGIKQGERVHLEPAVRVGDPLGGHLVQGHVDETGRVVDNGRRGAEWMLRVAASAEVLRYIVPKGSVALDGVSLTVAACSEDGFGVALVPHTLEVTLLRERRAGQRINIEVDLVAKYVEGLLAPRLSGAGDAAGKARLTEARLKELGY
jgi:riboflavin synthase